MKKEKQIVKEITEYLEGLATCWIVKTTGQCSKAGTPDIIGHYNGRGIFIEVKTEKGVVSPIQKRRLLEIHRTGGYAAVVRSVEDIKKFLSDIEHGRVGRPV